MPGGIRIKLALALLVLVGGSLLAAYLIVVPSLEKRLVDAKLEQLTSDARTIAGGLDPNDLVWSSYVRVASSIYNARVVVFDIASTFPVAIVPRADSSPVTSQAVASDPVAERAAATGQVQRARVTRDGRTYGEAAVPLRSGQVVMLSSSLADQLATVKLVQRRLLGATAISLGLALGLGSLAAAMHARRIRRLERAADRIAKGRFDEPVADGGDDELGQLARAFDRMRVQLAQLDLARKEFVANASHELRTPLFSLGGFLELLADEDLDEETRRGFLLTMREQVDRLTTLTADLLDLSRLDAGRMRIEREEVALGEVVRALAEEFEPLVQAGGYALSVVDPEPVFALADEERVLQVGRALVRNALVHTPAGSRLTLRIERRPDRAALLVEDDGPGIALEHQQRIFDRFYRIEGDVASGSGLGLAIARELAGRMDGELQVESRPGRTVFTLLLPAAPAARPAELLPA
jgi:two-component system OmpR family sensor kinase